MILRSQVRERSHVPNFPGRLAFIFISLSVDLTIVQQAYGQRISSVDWCFRDTQPEVSLFDPRTAEITFHRGGTVRQVSEHDEFGRRDGWTIIFPNRDGKPPDGVVAAQHFKADQPDGAFFFWEGSLGGSGDPYAFGIWRAGKPDRGVFLLNQGLPEWLSDGVDTVVRDTPPPLSRYRNGVDSKEEVVAVRDRIHELKSDVELYRQFCQLRSVAVTCSQISLSFPAVDPSDNLKSPK